LTSIFVISESLQISETNFTRSTLLGGRYKLLNPIGSGVSADVFVAQDLILSRKVAVKRLRPALSNDDRFLNLFRTEAKVSAQLNHENILAIYDWGQDDGVYLVTELLTGGTLMGMLKQQKKLDISQAADVALQAANGLEAAHAEGLVHRDIKPANLLFDSIGRLRIADFGVARAVAESSWTELTGSFVGTVRYAAPEQVKRQSGDRPIDSRADIYSLGLCIAEMVSGKVPLLGDDPFSTITLRQKSNLVVSDNSYGVLSDLIESSCRLDPSERPTAEECIEALALISSELEVPEILPLNRIHLLEADDSDDLTVVMDGDNKDEKPYRRFIGQGLKDRFANLVSWTTDLRSMNLFKYFVAALLLLISAGGLFTILSKPDVVTTQDLLAELPQAKVLSNYVGQPFEEVQTDLADSGWNISKKTQRKDGTDSGEIISQLPISGEPLKNDGTIEFIVSEGEELETIPNVVGLDRAEAKELVENLGLIIGEPILRASETLPVGEVMAIYFEGEDVTLDSLSLEKSSTVQLLISSGPAARSVPKVVGMTTEKARSLIEDSGLTFEVKEVFSEFTETGKVAMSSPAAGAQAAKGSTVVVSVSKGQQPIVVPNLVGQSGNEAIAKLEKLGLVARHLGGSKDNKVIEMNPAAGKTMFKGETVIIVTSSLG